MTTRAQRRAIARDRRAHASRNPGRFVLAPAHMVENPNRGMRGVAPMLPRVTETPDIAFRTLHAS